MLIAVAITAVLASIAVYNVKFGDKISEAEALVLQQALMNYIPQQVKHYYLRGDRAAWSSKVSQIQNEMADWPNLQNALLTATVYKDDGIEIKFKTVYQDEKRK